MEVICAPDMNVIFWRENARGEWQSTDLDEMIRAYEDEPYTDLIYRNTVYRESTEEPLYYAFECDKCKEIILAVDANHGYQYCPYCGRAIWSE